MEHRVTMANSWRSLQEILSVIDGKIKKKRSRSKKIEGRGKPTGVFLGLKSFHIGNSFEGKKKEGGEQG